MNRRQCSNNGISVLRLTPAQKIPSTKDRSKIIRLEFWYQDIIILIDYLTKGQINSI